MQPRYSWDCQGWQAAAGTVQRPAAAVTVALATPVYERYAIRRGSGGAGRHRGGDGVIRAYRALARCTVTLITERRTLAPRGSATKVELHIGGDASSPIVEQTAHAAVT